MTAVQSSKKELRKLIRKSLNQIPLAALQEQSSNVFNTLVSLPEYLAAQRISVYLSMPTGEISTTPIVRDALDHGKAVYVPYLHKNNGNEPSSVMDMLKLHSLKEFESLKPDKWGIPTLDVDTIERRENSLGGCGVGEVASTRKWNGGLDLILMPGMAFDLDMGRLGHGKGYYDFFLHRYQDAVRAQINEGHQKVGPFLVGLALDEQLLPAGELVPTDSTDWRLHGIIAGDGSMLRCKG